jgi:hypothetical protein
MDNNLQLLREIAWKKQVAAADAAASKGEAMRPLLIDDAARAEVARVVAYAMDHPYFPNRPIDIASGASLIPGDDPGHVANLSTYRCVFTFTHLNDRVHRHLTISVPRPGMYPNMIAAFMIAELFGFTGYNEQEPGRPGPDWYCDVKRDENCVMIVQEM